MEAGDYGAMNDDMAAVVEREVRGRGIRGVNLFATDHMIRFARAVEELRQLLLKPEVMEKWLGGNAAALLGLES